MDINDILGFITFGGMILTLFSSLLSAIISLFSLRSSERAAKHASYLTSVTASRGDWQQSVREAAADYFPSAELLSHESTDTEQLEPLYQSLVKAHYRLSVFFFREQDAALLADMDDSKHWARCIVETAQEIGRLQFEQSSHLLSHGCEDSALSASLEETEATLATLRIQLRQSQANIFNIVMDLVEQEWRKQKREAHLRSMKKE